MAEASASSYEPILQFLSVLIQPCVLGAFLVYFTFKKEVSWCSLAFRKADFYKTYFVEGKYLTRRYANSEDR